MLSRIVTLVFAWGLAGGLALAQTSPAAAQPEPRASVSFNGGLAAGSHDTGAALGGTVTFQLTDRLAIEGTGGYLDRGPGSDAVALNANLLITLTRSDAKAVPYAAIGGGLYRASFDLGHRGLFGAMGSPYAPGTQLIPIQRVHGFGMMQGPYAGPSVWTGPWTGPMFTPGQMPAFYINRLGPMAVPANGNWGLRTFTDPAITLGGGIRFDVTPHFFVRPDARALVIVGDGDTYTVGVFSFNLGYRF